VPLSRVNAEACFVSWPNAQIPGLGELINVCAAPIAGACMNVCCATFLPNGLVSSTCGEARSSDPRGRACSPTGKLTGEEEVLSDGIPALLAGLKSIFF